MSHQNDAEPGNSGYGSSDETASLLVVSTTNNNVITTASTRGIPKMSSINGPTSTSASNKPTLQRQECTSSYMVSPNLSQMMGGSEESGGVEDHHQNQRQSNATSVPDLDAQYRLEAPIISISNSTRAVHRGSVVQLTTPNLRCRSCRTCDRRASTTPVSTLHLTRSISKESVRSMHLSPYSPHQQSIPPVLITSSPTSGSRIIRQSSQPESGMSGNIICNHTNCSHSLRQLRESTDQGIAGIAADTLRISGAMRPFRQVSLIFPKF